MNESSGWVLWKRQKFSEQYGPKNLLLQQNTPHLRVRELTGFLILLNTGQRTCPSGTQASGLYKSSQRHMRNWACSNIPPLLTGRDCLRNWVWEDTPAPPHSTGHRLKHADRGHRRAWYTVHCIFHTISKFWPIYRDSAVKDCPSADLVQCNMALKTVAIKLSTHNFSLLMLELHRVSLFLS